MSEEAFAAAGFAAGNYTPAAQASLASALKEAQLRGADHVEPEHLLMTLLHPDAGNAWNLLVGLLGDPSSMRNRTEAALPVTAATTGGDMPTASFRTERALRDASEVAQQAGTPVDTPHLLLGLLDEGGAAAAILRGAGLDARRLRHWLRQAPKLVQPAPAQAAASVRAVPKVDTNLMRAPLRKALLRLIDWRAVLVLAVAIVVGAWLASRAESETAGVVLFVLGGWVLSVSAHEFGHALAADLGGDHTVRGKGYLSFNPLVYAHVLLSIVMPVLFLLIGGIGLPGGAVYIERDRLRSAAWNSMVSAAGPLASTVMAFIMSLPFLLGLVGFRLTFSNPGLWGALSLLVLLNLSAVLFNLLPVPPLDGFGILAPWLPPDLRYRLYGFGSLGLWVVILAFWYVEPLNQLFWSTVYAMVQSVGIDPGLAAYGLSRFMFWR